MRRRSEAVDLPKAVNGDHSGTIEINANIVLGTNGLVDVVYENKLFSSGVHSNTDIEFVMVQGSGWCDLDEALVGSNIDWHDWFFQVSGYCTLKRRQKGSWLGGREEVSNMSQIGFGEGNGHEKTKGRKNMGINICEVYVRNWDVHCTDHGCDKERENSGWRQWGICGEWVKEVRWRWILKRSQKSLWGAQRTAVVERKNKLRIVEPVPPQGSTCIDNSGHGVHNGNGEERGISSYGRQLFYHHCLYWRGFPMSLRVLVLYSWDVLQVWQSLPNNMLGHTLGHALHADFQRAWIGTFCIWWTRQRLIFLMPSSPSRTPTSRSTNPSTVLFIFQLFAIVVDYGDSYNEWIQWLWAQMCFVVISDGSMEHWFNPSWS